MMDFILKLMDFILKLMDCIQNMMDFILKLMDFILKLMDFIQNMMDFILKLMDSEGSQQALPSFCTGYAWLPWYEVRLKLALFQYCFLSKK